MELFCNVESRRGLVYSVSAYYIMANYVCMYVALQ